MFPIPPEQKPKLSDISVGSLREMIYFCMCFCYWTEFIKKGPYQLCLFSHCPRRLRCIQSGLSERWVTWPPLLSVASLLMWDTQLKVTCQFGRKLMSVSFEVAEGKCFTELWSVVYVHGSLRSGTALHFYSVSAQYVLVCVYRFQSTV